LGILVSGKGYAQAKDTTLPKPITALTVPLPNKIGGSTTVLPPVKSGSGDNTSAGSSTPITNPLLASPLKSFMSRFGNNLPKLLFSLYSQNFCTERYSYCINECLGRPPKATPDKLITPCASAIDPSQPFFNNTYGYEFCTAKQYFCRYGECNSDTNCASNDSECQAQISKVVTNLDCPPLNDAQKNCGEASDGWSSLFLSFNGGNLLNFVVTRSGLLGIYFPEFNRQEGDLSHIAEDMPGIACVTSCWIGPYTSSDTVTGDPESCH
jgi:hypothetical protein